MLWLQSTSHIAAADIPPKANAGQDVIIKLPDNAVTLDGSASADDIAIVSYEWMGDQLESKPYSLQGQNAPVAFVTDLEEGVYSFYLKVTDGDGLSDVDDVTIIVEGTNAVAAPAFFLLYFSFRFSVHLNNLTGECNTILSACSMYRHLEYYCT